MTLIQQSHKKRRYIVYILLLFFTLPSFSQNIKGTITTSEDGAPLPGVNIVIKGTSQGTISDMDGHYSIQTNSAEDVLVFSFIGMQTQEIRVGNQNRIDLELDMETSGIEEIVVVGYGTVKKSDLTGAVSSIKTEELTKVTALNAEQGLQGKVSGVHVSSTSGAPGAVPVIRIRGVGTFNNSSPIFVVDGVILDDISFLNSGDIASMEVLKDASATAIYGSRGANGVIIITSKQGNEGTEKLAVHYSGEYGVQNLAKKIDLLTGEEFAIISNEIRAGSYNNTSAVPNTDWQDLVFNPAPFHNHQVSLSGATQKALFYFGLSYLKQDGIIDKSSYERISLKFNNTYNISSKIKVGNNITLSPYWQQNAPNVTYAVYRAQPLLEPYYNDGSFAVVHNVGNPLASLENSNSFNKGTRLVGNIFTEINLLKTLTFKSSFGLDAKSNKSKNFTPAFTVYNPDGTASQQNNELSDLSKGISENQTWLWENTLSFYKELDKHTINSVVGFTLQETSSEKLDVAGENLLRDYEDFWYLNPSYIYDEANNVNTIQRIKNEVDPNLYYSMLSYLARANYTYDNRFILTATFRRDGSSKFAEKSRFANFPSFAAGWNLGNETFMKDIPLVTKMKIRGSWGIIGNEKISYYDRFSRITNVLTVFGDPQSANSGATYAKNGNPDLKWESTKQTDIGLEIGVLDNRLTGEFDYFRRETDDILVELSTPGYLGNGQGQKVRFNAASVLNSGVEANINWQHRINNFKYSIGILGSTVHNEVLAVGGNSGVDSVLIGGYLGDGRPVTLSQKGLPIGAFYGYKTDGIFQSQEELDAYPHSQQAGIGDLRFVDINKDGKIDGNDRTNIGSPIPKFIFGTNIQLEYKSIDFSLDLQGQTGNKIFNGKEVVRPDPYNFEKHVFDRWTAPGTSNTEPRPSFGGYNFTPSDRFIQDGSFLRIRTLMLGYTLPRIIGPEMQIQKCRVYIKANNLYTFTKFTGYTPEIGSSDVLSNGIDKGIYPITAIYSIGLNLNF